MGIRLLQPCYRLLHRFSLVGMNMGPVGEIATSGEASLIPKLLRLAPPDAVICDVGANWGEFSIRCARHAPTGARIFAFEPSPTTVKRLQQEIDSSGNTGRIIAIPQGLSDRPRKAELSIATGYEGNASVHQRHQAHLEQMAQHELIHLITLDAFCYARNIERIFLLKVDIEGEEFACLRGAHDLLVGHKIDYLQFEFGGCNIQSRVFLKDFWDLLSADFRLYRILQNSLSPWTRYHELDEVFTTTNFLAVRRGLPQPG